MQLERLLLLCPSVSQFNSDESQLRAMLLEGYVPEARPVINTTTVTIVDIGLMIVQVMDLVSGPPVMTTFRWSTLNVNLGREESSHDNECADDTTMARRTFDMDTH